MDRRLADARKSGLKEEGLDAAVDVIAAVDAGILESLNHRIKARQKEQADNHRGTEDTEVQREDDRTA